MKIIKRNQIIISVIALMLITVGYMSFTSNMSNSIETGALMDSEKTAGIGDAKLVNSENIVENNENTSSISTETMEESSTESTTGLSTQSSNESEPNIQSSASSTEPTETTSTVSVSDYFATSKLERDKMYSQMLETYQNLIESESISTEQKNISTQEITNINNTKNSIMIAENLIKNLGFDDVVIFVNDNSTSVIIKAEALSEDDIAKIQNIVCREIGVETEFIHISLK